MSNVRYLILPGSPFVLICAELSERACKAVKEVLSLAKSQPQKGPRLQPVAERAADALERITDCWSALDRCHDSGAVCESLREVQRSLHGIESELVSIRDTNLGLLRSMRAGGGP